MCGKLKQYNIVTFFKLTLIYCTDYHCCQFDNCLIAFIYLTS